MCGQLINYDPAKPLPVMHHREFGVLCSVSCHALAERKYARLILGEREN